MSRQDILPGDNARTAVRAMLVAWRDQIAAAGLCQDCVMMTLMTAHRLA
jgi:hypothetical protein